MILLKDLKQGSDEWLKIRLGLVSASRFKDIMTEPKTKADKENGVLSATAKSYMLELIAEILTGEQKEITGKALEWGSNNEKNAQVEYAFESGSSVEEIGICLTDDRMTGASPDGFIGDCGMLEIKNPYNSAIHISTVINNEVPKEHIPQIQGNLWVNGRDWCDFVSFDKRIEGKGRLFIKRVYRDDEYIEILSKKVGVFVAGMMEILMDEFEVNWGGVDAVVVI